MTSGHLDTPMHPTGDNYRKRARECDSAAQRATTADTKAQLLALARGWRVMAEHIEQRAASATRPADDPVQSSADPAGQPIRRP